MDGCVNVKLMYVLKESYEIRVLSKSNALICCIIDTELQGNQKGHQL